MPPSVCRVVTATPYRLGARSSAGSPAPASPPARPPTPARAWTRPGRGAPRCSGQGILRGAGAVAPRCPRGRGVVRRGVGCRPERAPLLDHRVHVDGPSQQRWQVPDRRAQPVDPDPPGRTHRAPAPRESAGPPSLRSGATPWAPPSPASAGTGRGSGHRPDQFIEGSSGKLATSRRVSLCLASTSDHRCSGCSVKASRDS